MKTTNLLLLFALTLSTIVMAGDHWLFLSDKGPYDQVQLKRMASSALSERAIERRRAVGKDTSFEDAPVYQAYLDELTDNGAEILSTAKWLNAVCVRTDDVQALLELPFVESAKQSAVFRQPLPEPEPSFKVSEIPDSLYGISFAQLAMMDIDKMHDMGYTGEGVLIVTIDSGADITHPSLASTDIVATYDFINDTSFTGTLPSERSDQSNHGTKVLAEMGGYMPGIFIGAAFGASFAAAKTENVSSELQTEEYNFVEAVLWADSLGADIITSSLGYTTFDDGTGYTYDSLDGDKAVTTRIMDFAASVGILCVNSAGNERSNSWGYISPPADADSVLAVAAQNSDGLFASFSSYGPTVDGRIKPDISALGVGVKIPDPNDSTGESLSSSSGTSFAAPLIAAAGALVMQALREHGDAYGWSVAEIMMDASDQTCHPDNDYGYGRPYIPVAAGLETAVFIALVDSVGSPIVSDSITVTAPNDSVWTVSTDRRGVCSVRGLMSGEYAVEITVTGFPVQSFTFNGDETSCFVVDMSEGSAPFPEDEDFLVFPIPASDEITVSRKDFSETENMTIFIFDASGNPVLEEMKTLEGGQPGTTFRLDNGKGETLASGIYLIHIVTSTTSGDKNKDGRKKIVIAN
mgnify:CR=1 FL=1